eukprot:m.85299 g.85299  ORF g.85299 m.85299 type:complete len:375 (+) comp14840_c0_seq2:132-1256(+)
MSASSIAGIAVCLLALAVVAASTALSPLSGHAGNAAVRPSGLYALDPCLHNGTCPSLPSFVQGVYVRVNWDQVQPTKMGPYNWTKIDMTVAHAKAAGHQVTIGVAPGSSSPHWLYEDGVPHFSMTWNFSWGPPRCTEVNVPLFWDPKFLEAYTAFLAALAVRYDAAPTVVGIKVTGVDAETMETVIPTKVIYGCGKQPDDPIAKWIAVGYTPEKILLAWSTILEAYSAAFQHTSLVLMTGPWPFPGIDAQGKRTPQPDYNLTRTIQQMFTDKIGPDRCAIQNNGLSVWYHYAPPNIPNGTEQGAQALWYITGDPTCRMMSHHKPCGEVWVMNKTLQNAILYQDKYVEIYLVDILNPKFAGLLTAFAKHFVPPSQ